MYDQIPDARLRGQTSRKTRVAQPKHVLFERNETADEHEGLIAEDPAVVYPSLTAEFPRVILEGDMPIPPIEPKIEPHGRAEDAAANNANLPPYAAAGVNGTDMITNDVHEYDINDNDDIMEVHDVSYEPPPTIDLRANDAEDDPHNWANGHPTHNDDASNNEINDSDDDASTATDSDDGDTDTQGVRRSKQTNKGKTMKFADYQMLMRSRREARGGPRRATIRDGTMFFTADTLNNAQPIPTKDIDH